MNDEPVTFNVLGCCASRETFNMPSPIKYKIKGYVQRHHPLLILQDSTPEQYRVSDHDMLELSELEPELAHGFNRRMVVSLFNNNAVDLLLSNKGDWIIIDTWSFTKPMLRIQYPDKSTRLIESDYARLIYRIAKSSEQYKDCRIELCDAESNMTLLIDRFVNFITHNWGNRIILLNAKDARVSASNHDPTHWSRAYRSYSSMFCQMILERTSCYCITIPFEPVATDGTPVHYTRITRRMIRDSVDTIVSAPDRQEALHRLDIIYCRYSFLNNQIETGALPSMEECETQAMDIIEKGVYNDMLPQIIDALKVMNSPYLPAIKAKINQYGIGKEVDLDVAIENYEIAILNGLCEEDYTQYIQSILGDSKTMATLERLANSENSGNSFFITVVGRAYRDGRGVQQDPGKAAEWMRKAVGKNVRGARNELFDVLWRIGTPEAYTEAVTIVRPLAEKGDRNALKRLSRAYVEGHGVQKDPNKATELSSLASKKRHRPPPSFHIKRRRCSRTVCTLVDPDPRFELCTDSKYKIFTLMINRMCGCVQKMNGK